MKAMKATGAAKSMKVMKMKAVRAMPKSGIAAQVAESTGLKKGDVTQVLTSLADIGATEVKKTGKFVLPGLVMIKTRTKPATKAGKKMMRCRRAGDGACYLQRGASEDDFEALCQGHG